MAVTSFQTEPWKEREKEKEREEGPTGPAAPHYLRLYPVETPEPQDLPTPQLHLSVVDLIHILWQLFLWDLLLGDAVPSFLEEFQVAGRDCADQLGRGKESSSAETTHISGKQGESKESTSSFLSGGMGLGWSITILSFEQRESRENLSTEVVGKGKVGLARVTAGQGGTAA